MPISELDIELIDRYLDGTLKDSDKDKIEARRTESVFEEYLQEQILIREVLQEKGRAQLKSSLQGLESELEEKTRIVPFYNQYRNWLIAAAAAVIIGIIGIGRWNSPSSNSLYESYYTTYPNLVDPLTKGESKSLSPFQLYEQRDYKAAIERLSDMPKSNAQQWYLSLSYIGSDNYREATQLLNEIISDTQHTYYDAAQWYRALLYLKEEEKAKCKELLLEIEQNTKHPYAAKARLVLEDL